MFEHTGIIREEGTDAQCKTIRFRWNLDICACEHTFFTSGIEDKKIFPYARRGLSLPEEGHTLRICRRIDYSVSVGEAIIIEDVTDCRLQLITDLRFSYRTISCNKQKRWCTCSRRVVPAKVDRLIGELQPLDVADQVNTIDAQTVVQACRRVVRHSNEAIVVTVTDCTSAVDFDRVVGPYVRKLSNIERSVQSVSIGYFTNDLADDFDFARIDGASKYRFLQRRIFAVRTEWCRDKRTVHVSFWNTIRVDRIERAVHLERCRKWHIIDVACQETNIELQVTVDDVVATAAFNDVATSTTKNDIAFAP